MNVKCAITSWVNCVWQTKWNGKRVGPKQWAVEGKTVYRRAQLTDTLTGEQAKIPSIHIQIQAESWFGLTTTCEQTFGGQWQDIESKQNQAMKHSSTWSSSKPNRAKKKKLNQKNFEFESFHDLNRKRVSILCLFPSAEQTCERTENKLNLI